MINLTITNKKVQYTAKAESTNFKIEGIASIDENLKVSEYSGSIYDIDGTNVYLGNFNFNLNNIYINLQQEKELISEVSQLVTDTIDGIELQLTTTV